MSSESPHVEEAERIIRSAFREREKKEYAVILDLFAVSILEGSMKAGSEDVPFPERNTWHSKLLATANRLRVGFPIDPHTGISCEDNPFDMQQAHAPISVLLTEKDMSTINSWLLFEALSIRKDPLLEKMTRFEMNTTYMQMFHTVNKAFIKAGAPPRPLFTNLFDFEEHIIPY